MDSEPKENEFYLSYIEENNDLNGSGIEYIAKFINSNHIENINIINNITSNSSKSVMNEIMISLKRAPIVFKYFNEFESGINWICNNCLFSNKAIFNRCICCDKKRKVKLNCNKEMFWNKSVNSISLPTDYKALIWKNSESNTQFINMKQRQISKLYSMKINEYLNINLILKI